MGECLSTETNPTSSNPSFSTESCSSSTNLSSVGSVSYYNNSELERIRQYQQDQELRLKRIQANANLNKAIWRMGGTVKCDCAIASWQNLIDNKRRLGMSTDEEENRLLDYKIQKVERLSRRYR